MHVKHFYFFLLCIFVGSSTVLAQEHESLNVELGLVDSSFNKVAVPGDDGTRFNMRKSLNKSNPYFRLDYKKSFENKHGFRFLYAPLKITGDRRYQKDISFNGETFSQSNKTKTSYQFNSYRLTYFYQLIDEERFKFNIGLTGKIRDANIKLKQGSLKKNRYDLGFVPLIYLWSEYWLAEKTKVTFDFDGLAAPQGRAFDMALMLGQQICPKVIANLGYRILEGGVDNDKVYNFSQFNFYFASVEISF